MYYRLMNSVDYEIFRKYVLAAGVDVDVIDRIGEVIEILDTTYHSKRTAHAYGGFVLFFPDREIFEGSVKSL